MDKHELRQQALRHLETVREEDVENTAALFRTHVPLAPGQVVATYWPMAGECDCRYIIDDLLSRGIPVALPVPPATGRVMHFSLWDGAGDLVRGAYGVYVPPVDKPVDPDVVIVPLLAFDRKGNRLGRGAGHYDATLADLRARKTILAVGLAFAAQAVLFTLPVEAHDQRLDMVITPREVMDVRP